MHSRKHMNRNLLRTLAVAAAGLTAGACQDLTVPNTNDPDRLRALAEPGDVEAVIASSWRPYWTYTQNSGDASWAITTMSDEFSGTFANGGALDLSSEPRTAFNNSPTYDNRFVSQGPWYSWYGGISSGNEALQAIERTGMKVVTPVRTGGESADNSTRARAFAKFTQGLLHGYLSLYYDQAFITKEDKDLTDRATVAALKMAPHPEVRDAALASLAEAAALAEGNTFTLSNIFIQGIEMSSADFAKLIHSYTARIIAYSPRTPEDAAKVDWAAVIREVDKGIRADHSPVADPALTTHRSEYKRKAQQNVSFSYRADYRLIGPADVSGNYQKWLQTPVAQRTKFLITTPDRRITGATPTSNGSYFAYRTTEFFNEQRGTYHFSFYQWNRNAGVWDRGPLTTMTVAEMDLLKAEALIRLNRPAEAVPLINRTREANGKLPPVTVAGVPAGASCVPRRDDGTCGNLMDALMYEKSIEGAGIEAFIHWWDMRRWGRLVKGTPLHFPVPGRELITLKMPVYTTGGTNPGSAS